MQDIKKFLEGYDKAVMAADILNIASHFHDKFIFVIDHNEPGSESI